MKRRLLMEITFEAKLSTIGPRQVISIPLESSKKLPSRGMVMVQGIINNIPFKVPYQMYQNLVYY